MNDKIYNVESSREDRNQKIRGAYRYFGVRLSRARRRAGLSLRDVSARAEISAQALSRWEAGHVTRPSEKNLLAVANAIGIEPREAIFEWLEENALLLKKAPSSQPEMMIAGVSTEDSCGALECDIDSHEFAQQVQFDECRQQSSTNVPLYRYFGIRLSRARRRKNMSVREVASSAGLSVQSYTQLEAGAIRRPHPGNLRSVGHAIGLEPVEQIFDWFEENQRMVNEASLERQLRTRGQSKGQKSSSFTRRSGEKTRQTSGRAG